MCLFIVLLIILIILTVVTVTIIGTIGAAGIIVFGDVIVCALIIAWIMKRLITKRKK